MICILKWVEAERLEILGLTRKVAVRREGVQQTQENNPGVPSEKHRESGQKKEYYKDITSVSMRYVGRDYLTDNQSLYKLYRDF